MAEEELDPLTPYDPSEIEKKLTDLTDDQRGAFWRLYTRNQRALDDAEAAQRRLLLKSFRSALDDLREQLQKTFSAIGTESWDLATMRRSGNQQRLFRQIVDRIRGLGGEVNDNIEQGMFAEFERARAWAAYTAESLGASPESIVFGRLDDRAILSLLKEEYKGANFSVRLGMITDDMAHNIQMELMRSMIGGESWQQAARRIRDEMGTSKRAAIARANMIVRTELRRASSLGAYQFREENEGLIAKTVWVAHVGACQEKCVPMDGMVLEGPEDYPPFASHPNCTCTHMDIPYGMEYEEFGRVSRVPESFKVWAERQGVTLPEGAE